MCLRVAADGRVLGDGSDPAAHDRHAARHLIPHVWHHDVIRCEFIFNLQQKTGLMIVLSSWSFNAHDFLSVPHPGGHGVL